MTTNKETLLVLATILLGIALVSGAIVCVIYLRYKERMAWLETARTLAGKDESLVRSLDLATKARRAANGRSDVRSGLILIAVGAGAYLFFDLIANRRIALIAGIPVLVGMVVFLHGLAARWLGDRHSGDGCPTA